MKSKSVTIPMVATEPYFPVVLFIMLYKVVLMFKFVEVCHLNTNYWLKVSFDAHYYARKFLTFKKYCFHFSILQ